MEFFIITEKLLQMSEIKQVSMLAVSMDKRVLKHLTDNLNTWISVKEPVRYKL